VADALTADQIAALAQRERAGCNPGMLLWRGSWPRTISTGGCRGA
jgi:hypothetical protein